MRMMSKNPIQAWGLPSSPDTSHLILSGCEALDQQSEFYHCDAVFRSCSSSSAVMQDQ